MKVLYNHDVNIENTEFSALTSLMVSQQDGRVKNMLNECNVILFSSNLITLQTGILILKGYPILIDSVENFTFTNTPTSPINMELVCEIKILNNVITPRLFTRSVQNLTQDNIHRTGNGTYQIQLATFIHSPKGLSNLIVTADLLTGATANINLQKGISTTQTLPAGSDATFDFDIRVQDNKNYLDFSAGMPNGNPGADGSDGNKTIFVKSTLHTITLSQLQDYATRSVQIDNPINISDFKVGDIAFTPFIISDLDNSIGTFYGNVTNIQANYIIIDGQGYITKGKDGKDGKDATFENIVQNTGSSTTDVMSQNAVTEELRNKQQVYYTSYRQIGDFIRVPFLLGVGKWTINIIGSGYNAVGTASYEIEITYKDIRLIRSSTFYGKKNPELLYKVKDDFNYYIQLRWTNESPDKASSNDVLVQAVSDSQGSIAVVNPSEAPTTEYTAFEQDYDKANPFDGEWSEGTISSLKFDNNSSYQVVAFLTSRVCFDLGIVDMSNYIRGVTKSIFVQSEGDSNFTGVYQFTRYKYSTYSELSIKRSSSFSLTSISGNVSQEVTINYRKLN